MKQTKVFIDGENFIFKLEDVLFQHGQAKAKPDLPKIQLKKLIEKVFHPQKIDKIVFYAARLHFHKETSEKSQYLINRQRALKASLENQGIDFIISGNVRAQEINGKVVFREKGVDVKIAVDLISEACDGILGTAIICSSDSDLQPAVAELKARKIKTIYLGFESNPNKGLAATTDKTVLFRTNEILKSIKI